ncbi:MAG TPA: tryptophan-rich sensory protein, partial [Syntrophobacteraceae bacterium]|nr:tryptophan-rich sensory protein [Syntrophobacteraceae bacterium]
ASYLRLDVARTKVGNTEKWCVDVPFSVYLGWITVATVANVTDLLYYINWNGFGIAPEVWAVIMLLVASLVGLMMALTRRDAAYLFVLVWSFAGIAVKQVATPMVAYAAWAATLVALGLAIYSIVARRRAAS